ncbi:hypothetical protein ACWPOB_20355 [Rhodococcus sp. 2H158]
MVPLDAHTEALHCHPVPLDGLPDDHEVVNADVRAHPVPPQSLPTPQ